MKSSILRDLCGFCAEKCHEKLEFFKEAFDFSAATKSDSIQTFAGFDEEYDQSLEKIAGIEKKLESYRREQEKEVGYYFLSSGDSNSP